jgi:hypothetical protein
MLGTKVIPGIQLHQRGKGAGGASKTLGDFGRDIYVSLGSNNKFRDFQETYRHDRVAFVYDCLPKLRRTFAPYQEEILANYDIGYRRQAVRGPHGLGKTLIAAILVHHTLLTTAEDVTVPTLASVERQLKHYLWPEIRKVAKLLDWHTIGRDPYSKDELMNESIRTNGGLSIAFAVAAGDATAIEGAHASVMFYVFDEAKTIEEAMWDAAEGAFSTEGADQLGRTGTGECRWLAISTPGPAMGRYYDIHSRKPGYEDWLVRHVTIDESIEANRISEDWVGARARQWGVNSAVYKNRVLGEFASDSSDGVIPLEWIEAAMTRWTEWEAQGKPMAGIGFRRLGVDTARHGGDKTIFAVRCDNRIEELIDHTGYDITVTAGFLKPLAMKANETVIEMDSGIGAGVFDILNNDNGNDILNQSMNLIDLYMGAGTSIMDKTGTFRFNGIRSAAWWHMREILDPTTGSNIMMPPDDELLGDLAAPSYELKYLHGALAVCVETKENLRKGNRLGRSTDKGDAVVLVFWDQLSTGGGFVF